MSDWRNWARAIGGVILAIVVFVWFMNIMGDYRAAKDAQKRKPAVTTPDEGPKSSVTETGRPPLNTGTSTVSNGKTATPTKPSTTKVVVVQVDGVNLRKSPSTTSDVIRALKKNERLAYYVTKNGYYQVEDKAGAKGWVSSNRDYTRLVAAK